MSKKKGIPLDQFLKPDTNITNWAEEDDDLGPPGRYDLHSSANASPAWFLLILTGGPACKSHSARKLRRTRQPPVCAVLDTVPFPTAPKHQFAESAGEPSRAHPDLPDQPPWKVYIGNVPYELNPRDIEDVFKGLQVSCHALGRCPSCLLCSLQVEA